MREGIGLGYNIIYPANGVYLNMEDYGGITFVVFEATTGTTATLTFANNASGGSTATPAVIDHYYGATNATSGGVWHKTLQAASNVVTKSNSGEDRAAIEVLETMCPAGKPYVKCTANGSGIVVAILHDPAYARTPANLRSVTA